MRVFSLVKFYILRFVLGAVHSDDDDKDDCSQGSQYCWYHDLDLHAFLASCNDNSSHMQIISDTFEEIVRPRRWYSLPRPRCPMLDMSFTVVELRAGCDIATEIFYKHQFKVN